MITNSLSQGNQSKKRNQNKEPLWPETGLLSAASPRAKRRLLVLLQGDSPACPSLQEAHLLLQSPRPAGAVTCGLQDYVEGPIIWANQAKAENSVNKVRDA